MRNVATITTHQDRVAQFSHTHPCNLDGVHHDSFRAMVDANSYNAEMNNRADISWSRIVAEGVAIVASILLAFTIDAWWHDRQLRQEEQQVLQGLKGEFLLIREVLERSLNNHLQDLESVERLLFTIENGPSNNAGRIVEAGLLEMVTPVTTDIGNGVLEALLSSGRLDTLTNGALRANLAAWSSVIGDLWDDQTAQAKMVYEVHIPYFINEQLSIGMVMRHWYDDWPVPGTPIADNPDAIDHLLTDPSFRIVTEIRYGYKKHVTGEFEKAIAAADKILAEIEKSAMSKNQ